jgi:hypothetical protein
VKNVWKNVSSKIGGNSRFELLTWNLRHPVFFVLAKELSLRRELLWLIEGAIGDIPKLVRSLFLCIGSRR